MYLAHFERQPRPPEIRYNSLQAQTRCTMRLSTLALVGAFCLAQGSAQTADPARRAYESRCEGCHGSDGAGGGHGPAIVDVRQPRATTRAELRDLIRNGIPGAGMPAFP